MDIQQLKYVAEIAKTGSITSAARALYMGQPNLSKNIKELEQEIGITLFERTAKGVVPTSSGREFITYAQSILAQMEELESLYRPSDRHEVKIQMSVPRASYIADAFTRYIASLGNVPLQVGYRETNSLSVINDVFTGLSSMGVVRFQTQHREYFERLIKSKHLIIQELWEYDMVVLMNKDHELASLDQVPYQLLSKYPKVVHGDLTPVLPPEEDYVPETSDTEVKRIAVYDRGVQFDVLYTVPGSYMWVSPMPPEILERNHLVQRKCASANRYCDVVVYQSHVQLGQAEIGVLNAVHEEIELLSAIYERPKMKVAEG